MCMCRMESIILMYKDSDVKFYYISDINIDDYLYFKFTNITYNSFPPPSEYSAGGAEM